MPGIYLPEIDLSLCDGCGACIAVCRSQALALRAGRVELAHPDRCEYDGGCEPACPREAIHLPYVVVFGSSPHDSASATSDVRRD